MVVIGVLALQGDVIEHIHALQRIGAETREVRLPQQLAGLDGLIIPGGESTTIGKLAVAYGLMEPFKSLVKRMPSGEPVREPSFFQKMLIATSLCLD